MKRRVPAVIVTVAVLFVSIFSMSIFASAATSYTPRLTAPASSNQYYYSNKNIFYKYGYGMPNCTAYAYGRAYEILGKEPKLCIYDADEWFDYNKEGAGYAGGIMSAAIDGIMTAEADTLLLLKKSKTAQSLSQTLLMADRTFIFPQQKHQTLMQAVIAGGIFRDIST